MKTEEPWEWLTESKVEKGSLGDHYRQLERGRGGASSILRGSLCWDAEKGLWVRSGHRRS